MQLFYLPNIDQVNVFDAEESGHIAKVLRKKVGDQLCVTNGKGHRYLVQLTHVSPKKCAFEIIEKSPSKKLNPLIHLVIAPTKNLDRIEWLIEKAVEVGLRSVTFLHAGHSERKVLKVERIERKAISALKQSLKDWLPAIHPLTSWNVWLRDIRDTENTYIAHLAGEGTPHLYSCLLPGHEITVVIGPEGGFTPTEIAEATAKGITPVLLGNERLRTETAGMAAVQMVALINDLAK